MAVNAQDPGNFSRNLAFQFDDCGRYLVELGTTLGLEIGPAGIEEYFRLQDETIPDDTDVGSIAENFPELTKKIRAVTRELLNMLSQRNIESLAKFANPRLGVFIFFLGHVERRPQRG